MKMIIDRRRMVMMIGALIFFSAAAQAGNIALRAGYTPTGYGTGKFIYNSGSAGTTVYDQSSAPLGSGFGVQCYWMGPNGVINDPVPGSDDVLIGSVKQTGDDSDTWNLFSGQSGKYFHDYSASGAQFTSGSNLYFRTWNNETPQGGGALFGESNRVTAAYDDNIVPLPYNHGLNSTIVQFTQDVPAAPSLGSITPNQASTGGSPSITINANSAVHGRWYNFEVSVPAATSSGPFNYSGYRTATVTNNYHSGDVNTSTTKTTTITMAQTDDDKYVKVRARAANDYGPSAWTESGVIHIPATADPYLPVAITDLQATLEGRNVTLSWTAPFDRDRYGTQDVCVLYDIRVSTEAIVNNAVDPFNSGTTNPSGATTWNNARPVTSYFSNAPALPAPLAFSNSQSYHLSNITENNTFFFAIKSQDPNGSWSYISNVSGVQVGTPSVSTETLTFNFTRATGGVGINIFSVPFGLPLVQPVISNLYQLVKEINIQAGDNVVYSIGWWDSASKKAVGYEITYSATALNNFTANPTAGLPPLTNEFQSLSPIVKDRSYQINVIKDCAFTIKGMR